MFIALLHYLKPIAEIDALLASHREHLKRYFDQKKILVVGPLIPRTGGVIISTNISREEFEKIMKSDPFTKAGAIQYQIIEFSPTLHDACLKEFI